MEDEKMDDNQRENNYLELVGAIEYLKRNGRLSEDWLEDSRALIRKYRIWWPNMAFMNQEIQDKDFRKMCGEAELILAELMRGVQSNDFVNVKLYSIFLKKVKTIIDRVIPDEDKNLSGLEELMAKLGV
jgi:hypothetical protein